MDNLKRKINLMGNSKDNSGGVRCSGIKYKHPRLLMGGARRESSLSKRLVIEFGMDTQFSGDGEEMRDETNSNLTSSVLANSNTQLSTQPSSQSFQLKSSWPSANSYGDINGNPPKKTGLLSRQGSLSRTSSFDLFQQLAPYAKSGLDTDLLPTSTADVYTAQKLCSLRLNHLTELVQKGSGVKTEEIIKNLQYAKQVLETTPASDKTRRNSEQSQTAVGFRRAGDEENDLDEVSPEAVPPEVRLWLAQTFTKSSATVRSSRGEHPKFKSVVNAVRAGLMVDKMYRRTTSLSPDHHKAPPDEVSAVLKNIGKWEFDIWELNKISENRALRYIGFDVIQRERLLNKLKINPACLDNFLSSLEVGYSKFSNPYHNLIHGADVTQTTYYLLHQSKLTTWLTDIELLAILVAALIHDYEHTGTSNSFHIMTGSRLARLYNDRSVLENHHLSSAFELLKTDERNILSNLNRDQYIEFRSLVVDMVLATDMTNHFTQIKDMKALLACPKNIEKSKVMSLLLHAADISHPAKPWSTHKPWTDRLIEEFYKQGDMEKEKELPCSPLCDRNTTMVEESQIVFLNIIVQPTMNVLGDILEKISDLFLTSHTRKDVIRLDRPWEKNMDINRKNWKKLSETRERNKNILEDANKTANQESATESDAGDTSTESPTKQAVLVK